MLINVLDLEATCWAEGERPMLNNEPVASEIIQIGVAVYDTESGEIQAHPSIYVKPQQTMRLSGYCTELTGVTDEDVFDKGLLFPEAMQHLRENFTFHRRTLVTWGIYDYIMLQGHLDAYGMSEKRRHITHKHLNLKTFHNLAGYKGGSLDASLNEMGLTFEGRWHDAADDAYNTARIMRIMMDELSRLRVLRRVLDDSYLR